MKLKFIILFFIVLSGIYCNPVVDLLKKEISKISIQLPWDSHNYITDIMTNGDLKMLSCSLDQFENKMIEVGLNEKAMIKLRGIVYAKSITFQIFQQSINDKIGKLSEMIGMARNLDNNIEIVYIQTDAIGITVPKFIEYNEKKCQKVLFVEKCWNEVVQVPRGYYSSELFTIEESLKFHSYEFNRKLLNNVKEIKILSFLGDIDTTSKPSKNYQDFNNIDQYQKAIDSVFTNFSQNPYVKMIKDDFVNIQSRIVIKHHNDLKINEIEKVLNNYKQKFEENNFNLIKSSMNQILNSLNVSKSYGIMRIVSDDENNNLFLNEFFIRYSDSDKDYDIETRIIKTNIKIDLESVLVKYNDESSYKCNSHDSLYQDETRILFNLLEVISQKKSEEVVKEVRLFTDKRNLSLNSNNMGSMDNLVNCFVKVTNVWGTIVSLFKNSRSSEIKEKLIREGFDKFDETAQVQIISGLREEGLTKFFDLIERRLNVPEERRQDLRGILEESQWMDSNTWIANDIIFSINEGGKVKNASIYSNKDENNKYNFVITEIHSEFELAPDVLVITEKLSILGGIWSESKDRIEYLPKALNPEDLKAVFNFFQLIVFKQVASQFGIQMSLPK